VRIQPRYTFDDNNDNHDFFIRRFRIKGSGTIFDHAWYGTEFKIDSSERFSSADHPAAIVENAWVDFTVLPDSTFLRIGLYDIPISYNALTSDSKLLLMDRTLIKEYLTTFGFTDNTVGMMFHGRPHCGRFEWYVGLFDNIEFEFHPDEAVERQSDKLMPAGRVVWNLLDPATPAQGYADYQESYLGEGQRLAVAANAGQLSEAFIDDDVFDITVWGGDVFYNRGPWVAQAEYDWIVFNGPDDDFVGDGWYVQGGYFFYDFCWELAARYQLLDPNHDEFGDQQRWTTIGLNRYYWKHNLKIQMEYTFRDEQDDEEDNNLVQVQLQLDY
jgi:phosphate-selective porin